VLDSVGRFVRSINGDSLEQRSGTGFVLTPRGTLVVANWRTKRVTELCLRTGQTLRTISCDSFVEPICVTANHHGHIIVGDNGIGQLLVFDTNG